MSPVQASGIESFTAQREVAEHEPSTGSNTATPVATPYLRKETNGEPPFTPAAADIRQREYFPELPPPASPSTSSSSSSRSGLR